MGWNGGGMEPGELQELRGREQLGTACTPPWGAEHPPHSLRAALGTRQVRTLRSRPVLSLRTPGLFCRSSDMGLEGSWGKS